MARDKPVILYMFFSPFDDIYLYLQIRQLIRPINRSLVFHGSNNIVPSYPNLKNPVSISDQYLTDCATKQMTFSSFKILLSETEK